MFVVLLCRVVLSFVGCLCCFWLFCVYVRFSHCLLFVFRERRDQPTSKRSTLLKNSLPGIGALYRSRRCSGISRCHIPVLYHQEHGNLEVEKESQRQDKHTDDTNAKHLLLLHKPAQLAENRQVGRRHPKILRMFSIRNLNPGVRDVFPIRLRFFSFFLDVPRKTLRNSDSGLFCCVFLSSA